MNIYSQRIQDILNDLVQAVAPELKKELENLNDYNNSLCENNSRLYDEIREKDEKIRLLEMEGKRANDNERMLKDQGEHIEELKLKIRILEAENDRIREKKYIFRGLRK